MTVWIPWTGGECPVDPHSYVNVRCAWDMRDDGIWPLDDEPYHASELDWRNLGRISTHIVAYRPVGLK